MMDKRQRNINSYQNYFSCPCSSSCTRGDPGSAGSGTKRLSKRDQPGREKKFGAANGKAERGRRILLRPVPGQNPLLPKSAGRAKVVPEEGASTGPIACAQRFVDGTATGHGVGDGDVARGTGRSVDTRPPKSPSNEVREGRNGDGWMWRGA